MSEKGKSTILLDIYREVGEVKTSVSSLEKKLDSHVEFSLEELRKINHLDQEQNRSLDKHIEGVNTLKELYVSHRIEAIEQIQLLKEMLEAIRNESTQKLIKVDERLDNLEKPGEFIKTLKKVVISVGTVATALAAIYGLISLFL